MDISNRMALFRLLCRVDCQTVINCAANINLAECEADPEMAYKVNGAPVGVLAAWRLQTDNRFIQISTDNYFEGSLPVQHDEQAVVKLKNVYAASLKFDCFARNTLLSFPTTSTSALLQSKNQTF